MAVTTLINGKAYSHAQIVARIGGIPIAGLTSISYSETQEKKNNFGAGTRPVSRGHAAKDATAQIGISMNDIEAIRTSAPNGSLLDIEPFDIVVTFLNIGSGVATHTLKNCEFTSDGVESNQGDTDIVRTFDLVVAEIKWK